MSPFKSQSQLRKIASLEKKGKVKSGTFKKWMKETPGVKSLPEHVAKEKSTEVPAVVRKYKANIQSYAEMFKDNKSKK